MCIEVVNKILVFGILKHGFYNKEKLKPVVFMILMKDAECCDSIQHLSSLS